MILGIDPSTSCGFAVLHPNGERVQSGAWNLKPNKHEGDGARFLKLHDRLDGLYTTWPRIARVSYEVPGHMKTQANYLACYGLTTHVESWAERNGLEYVGFAPAEVKRAAGLKGNAEKPEMIAAAEHLWSPHAVGSDDEADALFVALALIKEGT
jgi:Holliday junction resolvasome RuvABC endonuclease subunit